MNDPLTGSEVLIKLIFTYLSILFGLGTPLFAGAPLARQKPRIAYITPYQAGSHYWEQTFLVMEKVAKSLDFEFVHYNYEDKNAKIMQEKVLRLLKSVHRPDAIIIAVVGEYTIPLMDAAEENHIAIIIQRTLTPEERLALGSEARHKYKHWIASFRQDEVEKGYKSAMALFSQLSQTKIPGHTGKIDLVALSGPASWIGSALRNDGMRKALKHFPNIEVKEVASTDWTPEEGRRQMDRMMKLYPNLSGAWAASDTLAMTALDALAQTGKKRGVDIFASGIDMSDTGLSQIVKGELVASSAMSMLGFAEMLIYIYDYLQGIDFAQEIGTLIMPNIYTATLENAHEHLELYNRIDKINFRRFSKSYNHDLRRYNVSLTAFLDDVGIHICSGAKQSRELCYQNSP
ncbi:MAG: substrate-binding domain-containing protein [Chitinophagaceae bacterium]|nr:substrate-binding domain-containing protein [Oligoflexus sp.]